MKDQAKYIRDTARATALEVLGLQRLSVHTNFYRVTERLLRNYKTLKKLVETPDDYGYLPPQRSSSISAAPPSGGVRDPQETIDAAIQAREESFSRTKAQFEIVNAVVEKYADNPEFIVIRMYYFNEDVCGHDRPANTKPYSFEEISEALESTGVKRSEKALRSWRTKLVQDMTVALFGIDGAISIECRDNRHTDSGGTKQEEGNSLPPVAQEESGEQPA